MTRTTTVPFDIIVTTSSTDPTPRIAETITVEVYPGDTPDEDILTPASSELIEERRAYHMGRVTGPAIRALRQRHNLTQKDRAELINTGLQRSVQSARDQAALASRGDK